MDARIEKTMANLKKNNIDSVYFENCAGAAEYVKNTLKKGAVITAGGSVSVKKSGVWDIISCGDYNFLNRAKPGITEEEQLEAFKASIGGDYFFCSSNAVTENGELVNVDGFSNRISSIAFGPKKVIMIVGVNKIVKDVKEGLLRVKKIAAPKNCVRLKLDNPCVKLGKCVSLLKSDDPDMCDGCDKETRICCNYLISAKQREKGRITVVFVNEELGY